MEIKQQKMEAANLLLTNPNAPQMFAAMLEVAKLPDNLPVKLTGEASALNVLIPDYRTNRDSFDRLISLVEAKRAQYNMEPLIPLVPPKKFDKNEYQRGLMAVRRDRGLAAANTENLRRPPSAQLIGNSRLDFAKTRLTQWGKQLRAEIDALSGGKPMSKARRKEISEAFWSRVETQLIEDEASVLRWIQSGRKGEAP